MTIKEAAEKLGVTKQAIRYHLQKIGDPLQKDGNGQNIISEETFGKIAAKMGSKEGTKGAVNAEEFTGKDGVKGENLPGKGGESGGNFTGKDVFDLLREQLAMKDGQIKQLTAQLADTTAALKSAQNALEGAQALHAATVKQLQGAQEQEPVTISGDGAEPDEQDEPEEQNKQEQEPPKRSFLARIFGKR